MRNIRYNIAENFNIVRWSLAVIVIAFAAVIGVYKYIDISDMLALTYTSLETTYLLLNDTINIMYIYLPLYLFIVCGLMLNDSFGNVEILKCGSRFKWIMSKIITLLFYTIIFFIVLAGLNFIISYKAFPFSEKWSEDFVKSQVFGGQDVVNFASSPVETIFTSLGGLFLIYFFSGSISILVSLIWSKEAVSLILSLFTGILLSYVNINLVNVQKNLSTFVTSLIALMIMIFMINIINILIANKKDLNSKEIG